MQLVSNVLEAVHHQTLIITMTITQDAATTTITDTVILHTAGAIHTTTAAITDYITTITGDTQVTHGAGAGTMVGTVTTAVEATGTVTITDIGTVTGMVRTDITAAATIMDIVLRLTTTDTEVVLYQAVVLSHQEATTDLPDPLVQLRQ